MFAWGSRALPGFCWGPDARRERSGLFPARIGWALWSASPWGCRASPGSAEDLTSALSWGCFARPGLAGGTVSDACRDLRSALPWGCFALPGRAIILISASSWGCFALPGSARGTVACRSRKTWGSGGSSTCLRGKGLMSSQISPLGWSSGAGARRVSAC